MPIKPESIPGQKSSSRRSLEDPEDLPEARFWTARRSAQARREMIHLPGSWAPRLLPVRRPYRIVGLYWARIAGKATRSAEQALERHAYPRPASPDASLWNRSEMRF